MASAQETTMRPLLAVSAVIDHINEKIGYICNLLVLAACIVSAANAMIRYAFGYSSNGWLELQWYMFAILVMFGASYTFKRNEHVRVEIFYLFLSERGQLWLDLIGTLFFLIPSCLLLSYLSWPFFMQAYSVGEISGNAGGLIRWPIKIVVPVASGAVLAKSCSMRWGSCLDRCAAVSAIQSSSSVSSLEPSPLPWRRKSSPWR